MREGVGDEPDLGHLVAIVKLDIRNAGHIVSFPLEDDQ